MKTITLVRHAKSSWEKTELPDFERPLNKRGLRDAPFMGNIVKNKNLRIDRIISSPAVRALSTARHFAEALGISINSITTDRSIYEYGPNGVLSLINKLDDDLSGVLILGHNPDLTHLINFLSTLRIDNLPTCGVVCIDFEIESWKEIPGVSGSVRFYEYPKLYFDND